MSDPVEWVQNNPDARTVTTTLPDGSSSTRPYTPEENAAADAALEAKHAQSMAEARASASDALLDASIAMSQTAHEDGQAWVQPTGTHDAYPEGATVTHGGKTWASLTPFNVWEPGVSGWREQPSEGYPQWVQPTGAHDAYNIGDRVTFEGANYESLIDGNVWSPVVNPAGWMSIP